MVAISSNDAAAYPADSPEAMAAEASRQGWAFPYLYDEDQSVAQAYRAACTPDFFLFDGDRGLVYRGQLDASRPGNGLPVTGSDLRAAVVGSTGRRAGRRRPAPESRLQHQVEARQRARLRLTSTFTAPAGSGHGLVTDDTNTGADAGGNRRTPADAGLQIPGDS